MTGGDFADIFKMVSEGANGTLQTLVLAFLVRWIWRADKTLALLAAQVESLVVSRQRRDAEMDARRHNNRGGLHE